LLLVLAGCADVAARGVSVYLDAEEQVPVVEIIDVDCLPVSIVLYDSTGEELGLIFDDTACERNRIFPTHYRTRDGQDVSLEGVDVTACFCRIRVGAEETPRRGIMEAMNDYWVSITVDSCLPVTATLLDAAGDSLGVFLDDTVCGWWGCTPSEMQRWLARASGDTVQNSFSLPSGAYFFRYSSGDSLLFTRKILLLK